MKTLPLSLLALGALLFVPASLRAGDIKELVAELAPTAGSQVHGLVTFTELPDEKIKVVAHVEGLEPNSKHGFHIHEFGDVSSPDGMATGGHFNPEKHEHALPEHKMRHAGDFGNIEADGRGVAHLEIVVDNIELTGDQDAIIGRGLIVHAKPDDGSQPVGNAGPRLAQAVIGVKNTAPAKK